MRLAFALPLISLLALAATAQAQPQPEAKAPDAPPAAVPNPPMFDGPEYAMGDPKAKVTLVEYASASCPHCARFDINVFPALRAKYIDTGKVRYVFREFLTDPVQVAALGFLLARCAGEKNYWTVVDAFFHAQEEIYTTRDLKGPVQKIAASVGLNDNQLDACFSYKPAQEALSARMDAALKAKINSTPSFLINGVLFHETPGKEVDLEELSAALDPLLATKPHKAHAHTH